MTQVDDHFRLEELRLVVACMGAPPRLAEGTQRHLKEGLARRILMIQASRFRILETASANRIGVLPGGETVEINLHLNAYYFQLRGALDNAAWALHYQYSLLGTVDEDDRKARRQCDLFADGFIDALNAVLPAVAENLRSEKTWAADLKSLRDPVAHRIPLYAVPGVASPAEAAEFSERRNEMLSAVQSGDASGALSKIVEADRIGRYRPIFGQSGPQGTEVREIGPQIERDHSSFLRVTRHVIDGLIHAV